MSMCEKNGVGVRDTLPRSRFCNGDYDEDSFTPEMIYNQLKDFVIGQDEACRAAALIFFNTFAYRKTRRSVNLFIGGTGSGKTLIWETLQKIYPSTLVIVDSSQLTASGWKGRSIDDVFLQYGINGDKSTIICLDEFDKLVKPRYGGSGGKTDYSQLVQYNLLKLFDGADVDFGEYDEKDKKHINVWGRRLTFVLMGAFADIYDVKKEKRSIGFGAATQPETKESISAEQLIDYGVLPEIMGRITRTVELNPISLDCMAAIGRKTALNMSLEYGTNITVSQSELMDMAQKAIDSGLGGRYMRTQIQARLDDLVYAHPFASHYVIGEPEPEREKEKDCYV